MSTPNRDQAASWNGESGQRWAASADRRDQVLAPVARALISRAQPARDDRVVDVGCGCGATSIAAGETVGPGGSVIGIDLSVPMLAVARQRATQAQLPHVTFVEGDVQTHPFEPGRASLVMSRFGTMFFDDPVAALANLERATAPAGRLCIATWQPLLANEWLTVPASVLLRYTAPPDQPAGPGMFSQSDPHGLADQLEAAGFGSIASEAVTVTLTLGRDSSDAATYLAESGPGRALLDTIADPENRAEAIADVEAELAAHAGPDGVQLGAAVLITTATSPS